MYIKTVLGYFHLRSKISHFFHSVLMSFTLPTKQVSINFPYLLKVFLFFLLLQLSIKWMWESNCYPFILLWFICFIIRLVFIFISSSHKQQEAIIFYISRSYLSSIFLSFSFTYWVGVSCKKLFIYSFFNDFLASSSLFSMSFPGLLFHIIKFLSSLIFLFQLCTTQV